MKHASWIPGQARNDKVGASWRVGYEILHCSISIVYYYYLLLLFIRATPESPRLSLKIIGRKPEPLFCKHRGPFP